MLAEYGICVMVMNPERVRSSEDHSPKKLMLSEEIIAEKSGGETSSRDGVYEVFVYPFPKIGHYVSVTRTGHRVGAASKREGWGGGYTSPSGCLPFLPHSLEFAQCECRDSRVAKIAESGRGFRALPHVVVIERLPKKENAQPGG